MALEAASRKTLGPSRCADNAHGLYFNVKDAGARSWVQRLVLEGRRRTFGLGPYPVVSLSEARDTAIDNVRLRRRGKHRGVVLDDVPGLRGDAPPFRVSHQQKHADVARHVGAVLGHLAAASIGP